MTFEGNKETAKDFLVSNKKRNKTQNKLSKAVIRRKEKHPSVSHGGIITPLYTHLIKCHHSICTPSPPLPTTKPTSPLTQAQPHPCWPRKEHSSLCSGDRGSSQGYVGECHIKTETRNKKLLYTSIFFFFFNFLKRPFYQ